MFHRLSHDGRLPKFLLLPLGQYALAPFRPGIYQGDGSERRVNIQLQLSDARREAVEALVEIIRQQLEIPASSWNSCSKPTADGCLLKAKLNLEGPKQAQVSGAVTKLPDRWPQRCNAFIHITCAYQQLRASELLLEVSALDFAPEKAGRSENPFLAY